MQNNLDFNFIKKQFDMPYEYGKRECVFTLDKIKLYHYQPLIKKNHSTPLLVVFATVNRPEILDLFPDQSFIHGLLSQGQDVYLLDWGYADASDQSQPFDTYVNPYLSCVVSHIQKAANVEKINLLGICQGGVISLCYAALFPTIQNLILISTPIDFHTPDHHVANFLRKMDMALLVNAMGNVPGAWLTQFFISMRPFELIGKKYLNLMCRAEDDAFRQKFLRMEKWLHDAPDQPGKAFSMFIRNFYQENGLIKNQILIHDQPVLLKNLTMPILNIMAEEDEIVPMSASKVLREYAGSTNYTQQTYQSGHIGIYVSDRVGAKLSKFISQWLKNRV